MHEKTEKPVIEQVSKYFTSMRSGSVNFLTCLLH